MDKPFLSVLIPVYNGENLLEEAVRSVLDQPCEDLEVLILDDGSTDGTEEVSKRLAQEDSRVKVIRHENVKLGKNRNIGIPHLKGDWTIFLDHDDLLVGGFYTESFREFLRSCERNEVDMIVPSRLVSNFDLTEATLERVPLEGVVYGGNEPSWKIRYEFSSLIYRTKMIHDNDLLFYEGSPEMESIYRHKAVYCARRVLFTNEFFFAIRRLTPTSITQTWDFLSVCPVRIETYDELIRWHENYRPEDKEVLDKAREYLGQIVVDYILDVHDRVANGSPDYSLENIETVISKLSCPLSKIPWNERLAIMGRRFGRVRAAASKRRQERARRDAEELSSLREHRAFQEHVASVPFFEERIQKLRDREGLN